MSKLFKLLMPLNTILIPSTLLSASAPNENVMEEQEQEDESKNNVEEYIKLFNTKAKDFLKSLFNDFIKKLDAKIIESKKNYDAAEKAKDFDKIKEAASETLVFEKYKEFFTTKDGEDYTLKEEFAANPEKFGVGLTFLQAITSAKNLISAKVKFDGRDFVDIVTTKKHNYDEILNTGGNIDDEKAISSPLTYKKIDDKIVKYFSALKTKFDKIFLPNELPKVKLDLQIRHEKVEFVPVIDEVFQGDWNKFIKNIFHKEFLKFDLENNKIKDDEKEKEKEKEKPQPQPKPPKPPKPDQPTPAPPAKPDKSDQDRDFPKESSPQIPHDPQAEILKIPDLIPYFENINARNFIDSNNFLDIIDAKNPTFFNPINTRYEYTLNSINGNGNNIKIEATITDLLEAQKKNKVSRSYKIDISLDEYRYKEIDLALKKNKFFKEKMKQFYDALKVGELIDYEKLSLPTQKSRLRKIIEKATLFLLKENETNAQYFLNDQLSIKQTFDNFVKYLSSIKIEIEGADNNLNLFQDLATQNELMFKATIFDNIYKNEDAIKKIDDIYDQLELDKEQVNEFNRNTFLSFNQLKRVIRMDVIDYSSWFNNYVNSTKVALNNASKLYKLGVNYAKSDLEKDGQLFKDIQKEIIEINNVTKKEQNTSLLIIFSFFLFISLIMMVLGSILISKKNKTRNKLIIILLTLSSFILVVGIIGLMLILL